MQSIFWTRIVLLVWLSARQIHCVTSGGEDSDAKEADTPQAQPQQEPPPLQCRAKWFDGQDSFVCVCSAEHCDQIVPVGEIGGDATVRVYSSDRERRRMDRSSTQFAAQSGKGEVLITVDPSARFQTIFGFGGAFSDSTGLNLNALSAPVREHLLSAYFHPERGIGYTLGRVPIASTDFSAREYSYVDQEGDFALNSFRLTREDLEEKIPHIHSAIRLSGDRLRLFASPWAAPAWMKTSGRMAGDGRLKGDLDGPYYEAYARYLKRFFDEYSSHGLQFWAMTVLNQPESGLEKDFPFQAMFMSNRTLREFAERLLLPLMKKDAHTANVKLVALDEVRQHMAGTIAEIFDDADEGDKSLFCPILQYAVPFLPEFAAETLERVLDCQPKMRESVFEGIGLHWYTLDGHEQQTDFHRQHPDKFILSTEACAGFIQTREEAGVRLGNWTRGWQYGRDVVQNMRHWANGWIDWNLCLDLGGGPNWANNFVDAPIIVNAERDEFYKQPMFYFLAHFSYFVPDGSVRIESTLSGSGAPGLEQVAFATPKGHRVLVLINSGDDEVRVDVEERGRAQGEAAAIQMAAHSIVTAIWA